MQRRMPLYCPSEGALVDLPYITGNAVRGHLRRLLMRDMLRLADYRIDAMPPTGARRLWHALMSGGQLESTDETTGGLDLAMRKRLRDTIPPIGLLGTAVGNQIISGCLVVEHMMPVCREYASYIPHIDDPRKEQPVRMFLSTAFHTRRDDREYESEKPDAQAVQMKVQFECMVAGTLFVHGFELREASAVETACLGRALDLWETEPTVGGKASTGYGRLALDYQNRPSAEAYVAYMAEHAEDVVACLNEIVNPPKPAPKPKKGAKKLEEGAEDA